MYLVTRSFGWEFGEGFDLAVFSLAIMVLFAWDFAFSKKLTTLKYSKILELSQGDFAKAFVGG